MLDMTRTDVLRLTEVDPRTGLDRDPGYYGISAWGPDDSAAVRCASTLPELAQCVGDIHSDAARFKYVLGEFPLGHFSGERFTLDELARWVPQDRVDPKPFTPEPGYPTASEVVRIEVLDLETGGVQDTTFGLVARGLVAGTTIVEWPAASLDDLSERVPDLATHAGRWRAIEETVTVGTIHGEFKDPTQRFFEKMAEA